MNLPHTLRGVLKKTRGVPCGGEPILLGRLPINSRQEGSSLQQRLTYMEGAVDTEIAIRQPSRSRLVGKGKKHPHPPDEGQDVCVQFPRLPNGKWRNGICNVMRNRTPP